MSSTIHEGRVFETSEESYESHYLLESFENDISILKGKMENLVNWNNERTGITEKAAAVPIKKRKNFDPDK